MSEEQGVASSEEEVEEEEAESMSGRGFSKGLIMQAMVMIY
jgi:hypothetical protein